MLVGTAVAPADHLDRHRDVRLLVGEDGRVAGEVVGGVGSGLHLDEEQVVGLDEADGEYAGEAAQLELQLVEVHEVGGPVWSWASWRNPSAPRASIRSVSTGSSSGGCR